MAFGLHSLPICCRPLRGLFVEGSANGVTSTEMESNLLNVARGSIQELKEDYLDYFGSHKLTLWTSGRARYNAMQDYCCQHNRIENYEPFFERWNDEEIAIAAVTLCCMVDTMMQTYQKNKEEEFVTRGGIKERMTAARLGYRTDQRKEQSYVTRLPPSMTASTSCYKRMLPSAAA